MGQVMTAPSVPAIILTSRDRLVATNADGGLSPLSSHIILFGENAGHNLGDVDEVIAQGWNAFSAGITDPAYTGSIILGSNAATGLLTTAGSGVALPVIVIGRNAARLATGGMSASVIIGDGALENGVGGGGSNYSSNVVIGPQACQNVLFANGNPFNNNVVMGFRAGRGAVGSTSMINVIIIGGGACESVQNGIDNSIVIGAFAAPNMSGTTNIVMGVNSAGGSGSNNVTIGSGFRAGSFNSVLGNGSSVSDGSNNVLLGSRIGAIQTASDCIILGNQAGVFTGLTDIPAQFLIEQQGSSVIYGKFYGASAGSVVFGNTLAANRTLPGTNIVQLMNGTATGNPVGGGMFYGVAGELRWRNVVGQDTLLTPGAGFTVGTLPAGLPIAFVGARTYVTDALAPAFGAPVAGGGAVTIPVFFDGAAWIVA
jgi:hypothetical protein